MYANYTKLPNHMLQHASSHKEQHRVMIGIAMSFFALSFAVLLGTYSYQSRASSASEPFYQKDIIPPSPSPLPTEKPCPTPTDVFLTKIVVSGPPITIEPVPTEPLPSGTRRAPLTPSQMPGYPSWPVTPTPPKTPCP